MSALNRHRSSRWVATWLAVFGLVFAPTLSRAMATLVGGTDWVEVCSSQGSRWVPATTDEATQPSVDPTAAGLALLHQQTSHCPLCGVATGAGLAPPPAGQALWLSPPGPAPMPVQATVAAPGGLALALPQPRAPPRSA